MIKVISEPCVEHLINIRPERMGPQLDSRFLSQNEFIDFGLSVTEEHQQDIVEVHELLDSSSRVQRRAEQAEIALSRWCYLLQPILDWE